MDCSLNLPEVAVVGYTGILVILNYLSAMAIHITCREDFIIIEQTKRIF